MSRKFQIEQTLLDNGLTVITDKVPETDLVYAQMVFHCGNWHDFQHYNSNAGTLVEQTHLNGRAHFAEHLVTHAHPTIPYAQLTASMVAAGTVFNFTTGDDFTRYFADGTKASVIEYLQWLGTALSAKAYTPAHHAIELGRISDEMRTYLRTGGWIDNSIIQRGRFGDKQVGGQWLGGIPETLANVTLDDIREWHDKSHTTDNAVLIVSGNVNHAEICELAFDSFSSLPRGRKFSKIINQPMIGANVVQDVFYRPQNIKTGVLFLTPGDRYATAALQIFMSAVRPHLKANVENTLGLYNYGASAGELNDKMTYLHIGFETAAENVAQGVTKTVQEMLGVAETLDQETFERMKQQFLTGVTMAEMRGWTNLERRAHTIQNGYWAHNDSQFYFKQRTAAEPVTYDDVVRTARNVLKGCAETSYIGKLGEYPTTKDINALSGARQTPPMPRPSVAFPK